MEKTLQETKQEKKIRLFNEHDDEVMMLLNRMESLGDAILYVLHKNYQMGNRNIEKNVLKTLVNRAGANKAGIRKIRDAIYILRNQEAGIVSRGGRGGGYRKSTCWADINKCGEDLFHSQAMSLLGTEKAMKAGARKAYGPEQIKMFDSERLTSDEKHFGEACLREGIDFVIYDPAPDAPDLDDVKPILNNPDQSEFKTWD